MNITEVVHSRQWVRNDDLEIMWNGLNFVTRNGSVIHEAPLGGWELVTTRSLEEAFSCGKLVCHPSLDGFWDQQLVGMPESGWSVARVNLATAKVYLEGGYTVGNKRHPEWSMFRQADGVCKHDHGTLMGWWEIKDGWEIHTSKAIKEPV